MKILIAFLVTTLLAQGPARAADAMTYLFPAPDFLPAFAPFQIAKARGYFTKAGLDVTFQVGKGGADVAKQVALGNADLGGATIDTVLLVRANGLPVKSVAMLGTGPLYQIVVRRAANIHGMADLRGKRIGVFGFQDNGFYNLQGVLSRVGMTRDDVSIQAVGPAGLVQLMISGDLDAVSAVPETTAAIEAAGVPVDTYAITDFFPGMAQVIVASEDTIRKRPAQIRGFVAAVLQAVKDIEADPDGMAKVYTQAVPQNAGKEAMVADVMRRYARIVYRSGDAKQFGAIDPAKVQEMENFYVKADILPKAEPPSAAFTNDLLPP
jgi:NitT/TauT family transport system substrate-binding protein